ncbi:MAG TPA: hypothetical protein ENN76_00365 [Euryarchaeota archaeon]|nr:hypothetical protein [Euryarchaeota archaeon]
MACLSGPYYIHWDDRRDIPDEVWNRMRMSLKACDDDVLVVLSGNKQDTKTACEEIAQRLESAYLGVLRETRQVHPDGTTGFERVLPGPDRMYPDTDSPPLALSVERIEAVGRQRNEAPAMIEERLVNCGVLNRHARVLALSPLLTIFEKGVKGGMEPRIAAQMLVERLVAARRKTGGAREDDVHVADMLFDMLIQNELYSNAFADAAVLAYSGKSPEDIKKEIPAIDEETALKEWNDVVPQSVSFNHAMGLLVKNLGSNFVPEALFALLAKATYK